MRKLRLAAVGALGALVAGAGLAFPASAQTASTYWTFQNARFGTCLTAGDTGTAFATSCVGSTRQQWDWVGDGHGIFKQLKNRNTGQCLMTDNVTDVNAVWTSSCTGSTGQWWFYNADTLRLYDDLGAAGEGLLRSSNTKDAVYATDADQETPAYYTWIGTHD
ncbi:RICIN domain-containing protein [Streptomyces adustus]